MSPACVAAIFEGDNGGATATGVSETEIRIGVIHSGVDASMEATIGALFDHFNQRFEMYGRRLVPVHVGSVPSDPVAARALAADLAQQGVFAVLLGGLEVVLPHSALPVELARHGIVTIMRGLGVQWSDRTLFDQYHPYVWSAMPSTEDVQANLADLVCTALVDKPARFAGDETLKSATRKFGVIAGSDVTAPATSTLVRGIQSCTGGAAPSRIDVAGLGGTSMQTALERMKSDGVTTMFCICEDQYAQFAMTGADPVGFHPEWIINPISWSGGGEESWIQRFRRENHLAPPLMLDARPRMLPVQARPWFSLVQEAMSRPGITATTVMSRAEYGYPGALVLATGIQTAGPTLTAETFAQGLMTAEFPNPGAGQAPFWQPTAGFGPGDHSFYDDYHVSWWSDTAEPMEKLLGSGASGSWCYLGQAARYRIGNYPADADAQLFNPGLPCR